MSYKQFSNLVSKRNDLYKKLVKKNGEVDPLRKTLLIIDEAHKLYGGTDLSTIERPDMNALHAALMRSYEISGPDSARLVLMTATPITQDPMELIKLINLMKPANQQLPSEFGDFAKEYLNEDGLFTKDGESKYLDEIAGHISYLNRENDARQFSQPIIKPVHANIVKNQSELRLVEDYDAIIAKAEFSKQIDESEKDLSKRVKEIEDSAKYLDRSHFDKLKKQCDDYGDNKKIKTGCKKIVAKNIKDVLKEIKEQAKTRKEELKTIRETIKRHKTERRAKMSDIRGKQKEGGEDYLRFKSTYYATLQSKCGKTIKKPSEINEFIKEHPAIVEIESQINKNNMTIQEINTVLKNNANARKKQIADMRKAGLKEGKTKKDLAAIAKEINKSAKEEKVAAKSDIKTINKTKKALEKDRKKYTNDFRKTLKKYIKDKDKVEKKEKKKLEKEQKALRKKGELVEEDLHDITKNAIKNVQDKIDAELEEFASGVQRNIAEKEYAKAKKKADKEELKAAKKDLKEKEKAAKVAQKNAEKETKKAAKEAEKTRKKLEKDAEKEAKKAAKEANKTRKIKK